MYIPAFILLKCYCSCYCYEIIKEPSICGH